MPSNQQSPEQTIRDLREREKELECLYRARSLAKEQLPLEDFFHRIVTVIPPGWQHPELAHARIRFEGRDYTDGPWPREIHCQRTPIRVDEEVLGVLELGYVADSGMAPPFLAQELRLLGELADVLGDYVFGLRLERTLQLLHDRSASGELTGPGLLQAHPGEHASWRERMAQALASRLDRERHGVRAIYLIGSSLSGEAGPASDIDLILHVPRETEDAGSLRGWLDGWSQALAEMNRARTGVETPGLLDVHFVTDEDRRARTSYAVMIESGSSSSRLLAGEESS